MQIKLSLMLPSDESTLPLVRHLCKYCMWEIGVSTECVHDVELALTEACANVIEHAAGDDQYEVHIEITDDRVDMRVIDTGHGFDFETLGRLEAGTSAEGGRGLKLMQALVDRINFVSEPESGTIVHLSKTLSFHAERAPSFLKPGDA